MNSKLVSFIIPTLNSGSVLNSCLHSIISQNLPSSDYEIIIADGGSTDNTLKIAQKYKCKIIKNTLKTAEAGKAVGVKNSHAKYICLIDSDNILPQKNWLKKMLYPLEKNQQIIGSEPIKFTYRPKSGIIERYSALIGANDPYAFVTGVFDRQNYIDGRWTHLNIDQIDQHQYILITLKPHEPIPTIGANGTIFRSSFLKKNLHSDYLFDIDIISLVLKQTNQPLLFAKVKGGIIHTFCESSIKKFIKKQSRRLTDYYIYQNQRQYNWNTSLKSGPITFIFYTLLIFPPIVDSIIGFIRRPDLVWLLHPFFCWLTLVIYIWVTLKHRLGLLHPISRTSWRQ